MARTLGPTATTSAHASRLDIWAVAGMRMPPDDLRSPSPPVAVLTSTRSLSILMASLSGELRPLSSIWGAADAGSGTRTTLPSTPRDRRLDPHDLAHRGRRHRPGGRSGAPRGA